MARVFNARIAALTAAAMAAAISLALPATSGAQQKAAAPAAAGKGEQFFPVLVYRTGAYAPNGVPWANGFVDYLKLVNAQGGINGVKITWEECETGYATDRGVECYERLKTKPFAAAVQPLSTGITFALTDKAPHDKVPLVTAGYGRSESVEGEAFPWNFPLMGTYWDAADVLVQHVGKLNGGLDKLKGKKIALVYHDSPFGKEPIALLQERAKLHGFELITIPVTHPGVEQKAAWLQIRQARPDYVFLWGWGVMNSTALREAVATGYPRDKMYGVWWAAAEPDVLPVGADAKGYNGLALQHGAGRAKMQEDILKLVHDKGQGTGPRDEVGSVLYNRGMISAMLSVEGVRQAQLRYGVKPLTGEEVRYGLENLNIDAKRLEQLGLTGVMKPLATNCRDHAGARSARIQQWDGTKWVFVSDFYEADNQIIKPMIKAAAERYVTEKKLTMRSCATEIAADKGGAAAAAPAAVKTAPAAKK
ncbi:MAG TPA: ABC transporter substrate-binding protein [Burkholderiaceae bacterium]|nr:ABC transporter substrate-binding protein [Burkholderiaceae bacterium]HQR69629.1 ABC transporter substrate-binding protein [Burkholderiaceae bacterium]